MVFDGERIMANSDGGHQQKHDSHDHMQCMKTSGHIEHTTKHGISHLKRIVGIFAHLEKEEHHPHHHRHDQCDQTNMFITTQIDNAPSNYFLIIIVRYLPHPHNDRDKSSDWSYLPRGSLNRGSW